MSLSLKQSVALQILAALIASGRNKSVNDETLIAEAYE